MWGGERSFREGVGIAVEHTVAVARLPAVIPVHVPDR
jgi:hypothetical protein